MTADVEFGEPTLSAQTVVEFRYPVPMTASDMMKAMHHMNAWLRERGVKDDGYPGGFMVRADHDGIVLYRAVAQ